MTIPLVVIVGPTASGKTDLAIRLAKQFNCEIISADSRAVYRGLTIGTAKPTIAERQGVPHWGINIVNPNQRFTAADFKQYADAKINEIRARNRVPILVGGTGLYVNAVVYDYHFPTTSNNIEWRNSLMDLTLDELRNYCLLNNITLPYNEYNKRHVVSQIMRNGHDSICRHRPDEDTCIVGITTDKDILYNRIAKRAKAMLSTGVVEEARKVSRQYGWNCAAMTGNVYPLVHEFVDGSLCREEFERRLIIKDRQLAKRQLTWFRRDEYIKWVYLDDAYTYIARRLATVSNL